MAEVRNGYPKSLKIIKLSALQGELVPVTDSILTDSKSYVYDDFKSSNFSHPDNLTSFF